VACGRNGYGSRHPNRSMVWQLIYSYRLADVQGQLNQVHTLTLSALTGISADTGMRITEHYKVYFKDPGFRESRSILRMPILI